jgi:hypothetical protein
MDCLGVYYLTMTCTRTKGHNNISNLNSYTGEEYDVQLASIVQDSDHSAFFTLPVNFFPTNVFIRGTCN